MLKLSPAAPKIADNQNVVLVIIGERNRKHQKINMNPAKFHPMRHYNSSF
jgi:hypothetical protein